MAVDREIDGLIEAAIDDGVFPGAVLSVARAGKTLKTAAYGYHTYRKVEPVRTDSVFDLASVTKPIIAVLTLGVIEDGLLSLGDPLGEHLPELEANTALSAIKIEDLLTHTSGILVRRFDRLFEAKVAFILRGVEPALSDQDARMCLLDEAIQLETVQSRQLVYYTSIGFVLLGLLLERITDRSLGLLVSERVNKPLSIEVLGYNPDVRTERYVPTEFCPLRNRVIQGEVHDEIASFLGGMAGHAGLFSTAGDLSRFANGILAATILSEPWVRKVLENQTSGLNLGWGLGWQLRNHGNFMGDFAPDDAAGHTGFTGTSFCISRSRELSIVFLSNRVYPSRHNGRIHEFLPRLYSHIFSRY